MLILVDMLLDIVNIIVIGRNQINYVT